MGRFVLHYEELRHDRLVFNACFAIVKDENVGLPILANITRGVIAPFILSATPFRHKMFVCMKFTPSRDYDAAGSGYNL